MNGGGMTVPVQRGSMAILQPPRSRFMITDILAGSGGGVAALGHVDGHRSPSPQGPRDLSVPPSGRHHHNNHHDDSDSDSSGQMDDHSVCSNGEWLTVYLLFETDFDTIITIEKMDDWHFF